MSLLEKGKVMEYNHLIELMKTVAELGIAGLQYEEGDTRILIANKEGFHPAPGREPQMPGRMLPPEAAEILAARGGMQAGGCSEPGNTKEAVFEKSEGIAFETGKAAASREKTLTGNIIKSPLVGTFYAAPAEDAAPFVQIGDTVKKGQTLGIVEAMKLMNDIESEFDGVVTQVLVANGDGVEYGQPLFVIE